MALEFDITSTPPTLADIRGEREKAEQDREILRQKNKRFLVYIVIIVVTVLTIALEGIIPMVKDPGAEPTFTAIVAYFTPYIMFAIFFFGNNTHVKVIEKPRKIVHTTLKGLKEVTAEELAEIADAGRRYGEITSYLEKVTAQGRPPVKAEFNAIRQWLDKHGKSG